MEDPLLGGVPLGSCRDGCDRRPDRNGSGPTVAPGPAFDQRGRDSRRRPVPLSVRSVVNAEAKAGSLFPNPVGMPTLNVGPLFVTQAYSTMLILSPILVIALRDLPEAKPLRPCDPRFCCQP